MAVQFTLAREYRPRASFLLLGVVWLLLFAGITADRLTVAVMNFDGTLNSSLRSALYWGLLECSAIYSIFIFLREGLWINGETVNHCGIFGTRSIPLSDVRELRWISHWNTRIQIRGTDSVIKLTLGSFNPDDQIRIVACLRHLVSEEHQRDWEQFATRFPTYVPLDGIERVAEERHLNCAVIVLTVASFIMFVMWRQPAGWWDILIGGVASLVAVGYCGWKSLTLSANSPLTASCDVVTQTPRAASGPPG